MIKYIRSGFTLLFTVLSMAVMAQSTATTSSPYSQYGLGTPNTSLLPQTAAMGGIATAINQIGGFSTINVVNPASYSFIRLTAIDIGAYGNISTLKQGSVTGQSNGNFRLSHFNFAAPVSKRSAISFGLMPYTELGYNYRQSSANFGTGAAADTNAINRIYSGDGSLSKAYAGYGFGIGRHVSFGGNVSYIFGNLRKFGSTEIPGLYGTINSRNELSNSISGVNFDFGTQVSFDFSETKHLTFGYSGSAGNSLNSKTTRVLGEYLTSTDGTEGSAIDTLTNQVLQNGKIKLPFMNHFGVAYQKDGKYLIGADYTRGNWSALTIGGVNQGLQNSESYSLGGQITPNNNSIHSYLALVDYRLGVRYDKTYINISNTDIKQYTVSAGLGLPLPRNAGAFYKINIAAEYGQRGTLTNNLIKENFVTFRLGFTLNDTWFQKYRFD